MSNIIRSGLRNGLDIPDHTEQLKDAEQRLIVIKKRLKVICCKGIIDDKTHTEMYDEVGAILYYIGMLSQKIFDLQETLQEQFKYRYLQSPQLGKNLFWQHYTKLHQPYTLLKNRCYRMFTELDAEYRKRFKKNPPNWKI